MEMSILAVIREDFACTSVSKRTSGGDIQTGFLSGGFWIMELLPSGSEVDAITTAILTLVET